ncbi:MAG: hypothetical protein PWP07_554 [Epulopiscium sp.]|mgnify:CR=1 FL=1|jgi:hypothetical protein|nr:hypothetical protein [Defluviitaleaceae bacterium]MDK2787329.1 hypothetical protein [Candidatus Epulonipiscium sp.]
MERIDIVKKDDKTKSNIKKLINKAEPKVEQPSDSIWDKKDPLEEALRKSDDEVLAKAIRELLNKDLLN